MQQGSRQGVASEQTGSSLGADREFPAPSQADASLMVLSGAWLGAAISLGSRLQRYVLT